MSEKSLPVPLRGSSSCSDCVFVGVSVQKDSHTVYLEQELDSLKVVLEMKNNQLHQKEKKLMEMDKLVSVCEQGSSSHRVAEVSHSVIVKKIFSTFYILWQYWSICFQETVCDFVRVLQVENNVKLEECLKKVQQENEDYKARMDKHAALSKYVLMICVCERDLYI